MKISIIIPALNEEKYIEETLTSIKESDFKDYETIVVANGCTDNTVDKARKLADKIIVLEERHVSKARNIGAKNAKGDLLVFLDADTHLTKDTLNKISEFKGNFVGTCKARPDINKLKAKLLMSIKSKLWWTIWTNGIIFCNKETFHNSQGFDENLKKGEDGNFIRKAKKHSKYLLANSYVINSMRRFEKWGYLYLEYFWIKEKIYPSKEEYEIIR